MKNITSSELIELLHDFDGTEYQLSSPDDFVADIVKYDTYPLSDIAWFIEWEPAILSILEQKCGYGGYYVEILQSWDDYLILIDDMGCHDFDPWQPVDGWVFDDADLSGIWYIGL